MRANRLLKKGIRLRLILFLLVSGAVLLTATASGFYAWKENKSALTQSYLESNYQYARKLSVNLNEILGIMYNTLEDVAVRAGQGAMSDESLDLWLKANRHNFNSILIVDSGYTPTQASPRTALHMIDPAIRDDMRTKPPYMRKRNLYGPYLAFDRHGVVILTVPIYDHRREYIGFVAGAIYLEESNALGRLLNEHFYDNGSYLYVTDRTGRLIIHPDKSRLFERVTTNEVINKGLAGGSGSQFVVNSRGILYMAGYAYEPRSGWLIVSQTPASVIGKPAQGLTVRMLVNTLPLFAVIWLAAWLLSLTISRPLHALAVFSERNALGIEPNGAKLPSVKSCIYEVRQLHQSMSHQLQHWNEEVQRDGLTGLANRKTFDWTIKDWIAKDVPFSLILMDIDHFKRINDTHGHLVGDRVLQFLAGHLKAYTRERDLCFRYGGEEFGILVRSASPREAGAAAERLRKMLARTPGPSGEPVGLSLGVAGRSSLRNDARAIIEAADKALYRSKSAGRGQTTVAGEEER